MQVLAACFLWLFLLAGVADASGKFLPAGEKVRAPIGWVQFCERLPGECQNSQSVVRYAEWTPDRWLELQRINNDVNRTVTAVSDLEHYGVIERWAYPDDGKGDCEDYVLEKRRRLMRAGWPVSALLITVVRDNYGQGHAVLMVRTVDGDYVLDSPESGLWLWSERGYYYIKRQSQDDPNVWVSLYDQHRMPRLPKDRLISLSR